MIKLSENSAGGGREGGGDTDNRQEWQKLRKSDRKQQKLAKSDRKRRRKKHVRNWQLLAATS